MARRLRKGRAGGERGRVAARPPADAEREKKARTGITGFDELARGGLPAGGLTVVEGGPGAGKTIFALEALVRGARELGEPGLFVTFEQSAAQVKEHAGRFAWGRDRRGWAGVEFIDARLPASVLSTGEFDLEGLLATLEVRCRETGAVRVAFDGLDALFGLLAQPSAVRREIFRLRSWIEARGVTAIVTGKSNAGGEGVGPDLELLQFACDCIVSLRHELVGRTAVRTIRVVKYRGSRHAGGEFPFAISDDGIALTSITTPELEHGVFTEKVSSGIDRLDTMLGGGYFRGSSILVSGAPGTAKTTLAAAFADAACRRGERTLYVSFDEAAAQIVRNLRSIGIDLQPHVDAGTLVLNGRARRAQSPDAHVVEIAALMQRARVRNLVVDPISAFAHLGTADAAFDALLQLTSLAKRDGVTFVATTLLLSTSGGIESTPISASTIADTWMQLSYLSQGGERNRALTIVKSRGMQHSNQVREVVLSPRGITLSDVYAAGGEVLMGTLRWEQEERQRELRIEERRDAEQRQRQAELALAEANARLQAAEAERALRSAALDRLVGEVAQQSSRKVAVETERLSRRGADRAERAARRTNGAHPRAARRGP
jgi:circadian clock protein KaiC